MRERGELSLSSRLKIQWGPDQARVCFGHRKSMFSTESYHICSIVLFLWLYLLHRRGRKLNKKCVWKKKTEEGRDKLHFQFLILSLSLWFYSFLWFVCCMSSTMRSWHVTNRVQHWSMAVNIFFFSAWPWQFPTPFPFSIFLYPFCTLWSTYSNFHLTRFSPPSHNLFMISLSLSLSLTYKYKY